MPLSDNENCGAETRPRQSEGESSGIGLLHKKLQRRWGGGGDSSQARCCKKIAGEKKTTGLLNSQDFAYCLAAVCCGDPSRSSPPLSLSLPLCLSVRPPPVFNGSVLWPYAILNEQQGVAREDPLPAARHSGAARKQLGPPQGFHRQRTKAD